MATIDVLDAQGNQTGIIKTAAEVHQNGDWHRSVHVWVVNREKQLLMQLRSANKANYPSMWDISAAGHIDAGESSQTAAIREAHEEIGILLETSDLEFLGTRIEQAVLNNGSFVENQFTDIYITRKDFQISESILQIEEVAEIKYIDAAELKSWIEASKEDLVLPEREEYKIVLAAIG